MKRIQKTRNWWSPAAALHRLGWLGSTPLSSLTDIGEPRIGVMNDAFMRPLLIEACGLPFAVLSRLRRSVPNDPAFTQILSIHTVDSNDNVDPVPLTGHYVLDRSRLTFIPDTPLQAGHAYRAILRISNGVSESGESADFTIHRDISWNEAAHLVAQVRQGSASVN